MLDLIPDYDEAIRFLRWLYPDGPWLLTAIPFDRKAPFPTARFNPSDERQVLVWFLRHESMNLYYHVNEPIESVADKKASKLEIARVHFLQIDMDVRKVDESEADGKDRILKRLHALPTTKRPSALINSGGGYNALWRLTAPIVIDGVESMIDTVEARNKQLAADLEGDVTHDISRILRLPGTINRLNQTKVDRGRVPSLSSIIWLENSIYEFGSFLSAPVVAKNQTTSSGAIDTDLIRTEDVDQLVIPPALKNLIQTGEGYSNRSDGVWFLCCEMIRLGIDERVLLGIITDSRYRISDHVYAQGSRWMQYALRQIRRAKEKAHNPKLLEMNDRFAVIRDHGGKCVVMKEPIIGDQDGRRRFQAPVEFFRGHDNEKIIATSLKTGKEIAVGLGSWWFDQRMRRQYERVVFEPGLETPGDLNLWEGFDVEPVAGTKHLRYLEHMHDNICRGLRDRYEYLLKWLARLVQQPRSQCMVAVVLTGDRGTGKSIFCTMIAKLFGVGRHAFIASDDRYVTGRFNSHLMSMVFLLSEEAFDVSEKRHESVLKEIITGESLTIEGKGVNAVQMRNYLHLMMTSNNDRVIPAGDLERRFFVTRVGEKKWSNAQFGELVREMKEEGGLQNLLHYLLEYDITGFDVTQYPETEELREQQSHGLSYENDWLWTKLEQGIWLDGKTKWEGPIVKPMLYADYLTTMASLNVRRPKPVRMFSKWLSNALPGVVTKQLGPNKSHHDRPQAFIFPPLDECRVFFAARRGVPGHVWITHETVDGVEEEETF